MKIEVGQYGRLEDDTIFQRVGIASNGLTVKINGNFTMVSHSDNIIKVADTPQELIQVGDLVCGTLNIPFMVTRTHHEISSVKLGDAVIVYEHITKILTPNSNGDYIKQWEVTNG